MISTNTSGTEMGWITVIRTVDKKSGIEENCLPVVCSDDKERLHFLVTC